jgi:hypothetical protein
VLPALTPKAAELRTKDLKLLAARIKGDGV